MNPSDPLRQPESRSEQIQVPREPEVARIFSDVVTAGRHYIEQIVFLCHAVDEQGVRLGKIQERYTSIATALEDTQKAHHKELCRIERCEKYNRLSKEIEKSLQPRLSRSIEELILQAGRIADGLPELRKQFNAFLHNEVHTLNIPPSLGQLWSLAGSLRILNRIALSHLQHTAGRSDHAHLLRSLDGSELEKVAHDLAFSDAELTRVRVPLEKSFKITERAQRAAERVDEYRGFAQEFADEVERLHSSALVVGEEERVLIEIYGERVRALQQIMSEAGHVMTQILEGPTVITQAHRDSVNQAREALLDEPPSLGGQPDRECVRRARVAIALLQRALEHCEAALQPASVATEADVSVLQMPAVEGGAEVSKLGQIQDDLAVRFGSPRDMAAVMRIEKKCFETPWHEEDFTAFLNKDRRFLWCAVAGNEVVGFVFGVDHERSVEIISVAVDPAYQRKGVGTRLLEKAKKDLMDSSKESISLVVRERNTDAQLFFQKCGLRFVRTLQGYFTDSQEAAYQMEYRGKEQIG